MIEIALQQDGSTVSTFSTFAKQMVSSIWIDSGYGSTRLAQGDRKRKRAQIVTQGLQVARTGTRYHFHMLT